MKQRAALVRGYFMGDFSFRWVHNDDKKETTSDLKLRICVSLIFPRFFRSDNWTLIGIDRLTSAALLWQHLSLKSVLESDTKDVSASSFSEIMKVDENWRMVASNDRAMNGTMGFSVWYSTKNLFSSSAVLAKKLELYRYQRISNCRLQTLLTFVAIIWLFWFVEIHPVLHCFHHIFPNVNGSFCNNLVLSPSARAKFLRIHNAFGDIFVIRPSWWGLFKNLVHCRQNFVDSPPISISTMLFGAIYDMKSTRTNVK